MCLFVCVVRVVEFHIAVVYIFDYGIAGCRWVVKIVDGL